MFNRNELIDAIEDLEAAPTTFQNCQKLATFYSLYDHLYGIDRRDNATETVRQTVISDFGDSDFLKVASGADAEKVFHLLDEFVESVKVLQPRLYNAMLTELKDL